MLEQKNRQRREGYTRRNLQCEKDRLSGIICCRFMSQPVYRQADIVMWYVNCRSEVITQPALGEALKSNKRTVVPYCTEDEQGDRKLGLWLLEDVSELQPGMWGILEPTKARWGEPGKEIAPDRLDLIIVPGVAFDRSGGRLGNGAGYYDRLLAKVRKNCTVCGICFESQLVEHIEREPHDIAMDYVITEKTIYYGEGR